MRSQEEDTHAFSKLGLTVSQAKVYLSLATMGKADGKTLWKCTGVPRQDIYRVLAELQEKGLVEKIVHTPTQYMAIPIENGISTLVHLKAAEYKEIEEDAKELVKRLIVRNLEDNLKKDCKIVLSAKQANRKKAEQAIANVKRSLNAVVTPKTFSQIVFHEFEKLEEAAKRGVAVQVLVEKNGEKLVLPENLGVLLAQPNFKLKFVANQPKIVMGVFDNEEAVIAVNSSAHGDFGENTSMWTTDPSIVAICQGFFEKIWESSNTDEKTDTNRALKEKVEIST
jgi:sugar-specific transcriptional regulator TrmB